LALGDGGHDGLRARLRRSKYTLNATAAAAARAGGGEKSERTGGTARRGFGSSELGRPATRAGQLDFEVGGELAKYDESAAR